MPGNAPVMPAVAIRAEDLGKAYRVFRSKRDNLLDALGLDRISPWRRRRHFDFWALRGVTFDLAKGRRLGVIGRNGAGKTTLLKLITGNLRPTEGRVDVHGKVQAMIDIGTGFHPDFTGRENVLASLTYQGFSPREIIAATEEIADFTELGEFMDRPFRTYSSGMMARLAFGTATAIKPEILIIDEILGAGDAYFVGKSNERMRRLVESGASIVLVSHSMEQITLLCDSAIWLDRGRIVKSGPSLDVITAYTQFIRQLEDRRRRARNLKVATGRRLANETMDWYADTATLRFVVAEGSRVDVAGVRLLRGADVEAECRVGDAQDSEPSQSAYVSVADGAWSAPANGQHRLSRAITGRAGAEVSGSVCLNLYAWYPHVNYTLEVDHSARGGGVELELWRGGVVMRRFQLEPTGGEFRVTRFELSDLARAADEAPAAVDAVVPADGETLSAQVVPEAAGTPRAASPTRWPGEGSLLIESVSLLDGTGAERAVFESGAHMSLAIVLRAVRAGTYPVTPAAVFYRVDGVKAFSHIGDEVRVDVTAGERLTLELVLERLNLGDGHYAIAVAVYKVLDPIGESMWYDLIDRDYRFEVVGAPAFAGMFEHPGKWRLTRP